MASRISASWRYVPGAIDFDASFDAVCTTLLDVFAEHQSASVQATIWTIPARPSGSAPRSTRSAS